MRNINKGYEPQEWIAHRKTDGAVYEAKPELRDSLLHEQGHICAYCMRRITVSDGSTVESTRIEHILSRENHPDLQLNYSNMVLCCDGKIDSTSHCDVSKQSNDVTFDLFSDPFFTTVSYGTKDGQIKSSNSTYDTEINSILNLNHKLLKANRLNTLKGIKLYLNKKGWTVSNISAQLNIWDNKDSNGQYKPYNGIVVWFLKNKLRQGVRK